MRIVGFLSAVLSLVSAVVVADQPLSRSQIAAAAEAQFLRTIDDYRTFLAIPNDGNYPQQIDRNARWCMDKFLALGFESRVISSHGVKHVYAEKIYDPEKKNILFYLQIDGQPVDTSAWQQSNPYTAVLKDCKEEICTELDWNRLKKGWNPDWKVFARSSSDAKGPAMAFIAALEIIKQQKIIPDFNIKVIMDFQEEIGSPTLPALVEANQELLQAEMLLIMDGTRHLSNLPTLTFGARGIATVTLKVFGANRDLHSGQYGNFVPNPVFKLADLIAGMKDESGRVTIPGFYEGVNLSRKEKQEINSIPEQLEQIKSTLGIADIDRVGKTYQETLQYPSLNVRGIRAAWVGKEVRTLIPSEAVAEIDMRLVPETPGKRQVDLLKNYIRQKGYHFVDGEPTEAERRRFAKLISFTSNVDSEPFRTELDSAIGKWLGDAMGRTFGTGNYVRMRSTGGTQPIAPFIDTLGIPAVSVRIPNPDNNIHAPDENLRLGNFLEGIEMCLGILTQKMN